MGTIGWRSAVETRGSIDHALATMVAVASAQGVIIEAASL
jgi:hypothetical protein